MSSFFSSMARAFQTKPHGLSPSKDTTSPSIGDRTMLHGSLPSESTVRPSTAGYEMFLASECEYSHLKSNRVWKVALYFGYGPKTFEKQPWKVDLNLGWEAELHILTTDIVGLMQEGLYVSQNNVLVRESNVKTRRDEEKQVSTYDRYYTLADPNWTGKLMVKSNDVQIVADFRVEHLSADAVYWAQAVDLSKGEENLVYRFSLDPSGFNANFILDDAPMKGLWPSLRQELGDQAGSLKEKPEVAMTDFLLL
ncbi:hypothetical protein F53441_13387 [Fusarium austroafricanum]|uniref:Uncharacterized protein n=1 Tax=Fusarium austroafricanum TaxID=2364996 RepID=A0A8H4NI52_9HYPO|nr:hypothetical protein F53441_13387 [Fusarium austroafricanum]